MEAALARLPCRGNRVVATGRGNVAILRTADDSGFTPDDRCPREGRPLSQGIVHGHAVTGHRVVDLAPGEAQAPDIVCAKRTPMRLDGGRVLPGLAS